MSEGLACLHRQKSRGGGGGETECDCPVFSFTEVGNHKSGEREQRDVELQ